jgi:hypothetical protein
VVPADSIESGRADLTNQNKHACNIQSVAVISSGKEEVEDFDWLSMTVNVATITTAMNVIGTAISGGAL